MSRHKPCCKCSLMERRRAADEGQNVPPCPTWRSRRFMEHLAYMPTTSNEQTADEDDHYDGVVATSSISLLNRIKPVQRMKQEWEAKLQEENSAVEKKLKSREGAASRRYREELHQLKQEQVVRKNVQAKYWRSKKTFTTKSEQILEQRQGQVTRNAMLSKTTTAEANNDAARVRDSYIESEDIKRLLRDSGDYTYQTPSTKQKTHNLQTGRVASPEKPPKDATCTVVDKWYMSCDSGSLLMSRRIITKEGLVYGGSSGVALSCAVKAVKEADLKERQRCMIMLPDGLRNHLTTFLNDQWIAERGFLPEKNLSRQYFWWDTTVAYLKLQAPLTIFPEVKIQDAIDIMKKKSFDQMPVVDRNGGILGMVTLGSLLTCILHTKLEANDPVENALYHEFKKVRLDMTLGQLAYILNTDHFVLVIHSQIEFSGPEHEEKEKEVIIGVVTQIDLLNYITGAEEHHKVLYGTAFSKPPIPDTDISVSSN